MKIRTLIITSLLLSCIANATDEPPPPPLYISKIADVEIEGGDTLRLYYSNLAVNRILIEVNSKEEGQSVQEIINNAETLNLQWGDEKPFTLATGEDEDFTLDPDNSSDFSGVVRKKGQWYVAVNIEVPGLTKKFIKWHRQDEKERETVIFFIPSE